MKEIIYFKTSNSSFVITDKEILEKHFHVKTYHIDNKNGAVYIISLIKLIFFLLTKAHGVKIFFIRFADWHTALLAFFKRIYGIKLIIVVGGFDAFHIPEYKYGVYQQKFRGWCAKYALRNADYILPNSPCLIDYTNTYASTKPIRGGIKFFVPDIKGKIKVVYNGFDTGFWDNMKGPVKKNHIITVAIVNNLRNFYLKGIDSFIEIAQALPQYDFRIIGLNKEFLAKNNIVVPKNLEVIEYVQHKELLHFYREARVFCLLSLTEGMSNVLCEAMLCECIPVGSNVTFIPEMIGNSGFIIQNKQINEMKQKVEEAMNGDLSLGKRAKQRIIDNYSIEKREKELTELIKDILAS